MLGNFGRPFGVIRVGPFIYLPKNEIFFTLKIVALTADERPKVMRTTFPTFSHIHTAPKHQFDTIGHEKFLVVIELCIGLACANGPVRFSDYRRKAHYATIDGALFLLGWLRLGTNGLTGDVRGQADSSLVTPC